MFLIDCYSDFIAGMWNSLKGRMLDICQIYKVFILVINKAVLQMQYPQFYCQLLACGSDPKTTENYLILKAQCVIFRDNYW